MNNYKTKTHKSYFINHKSNSKGFTLVELLVVISIIAVLAALAFVSYTSAQRQSRDTRRKADLKQYANAMEVFASKNNSLYVYTGSSAAPLGGTAGSTWCTTMGLGTDCPTDPRNAVDSNMIYRIQTNGSGTAGTSVTASQWVIWAQLENVGSGAPARYFVICSNGKVGERASFSAGSGTCPI